MSRRLVASVPSLDIDKVVACGRGVPVDVRWFQDEPDREIDDATASIWRDNRFSCDGAIDGCGKVLLFSQLTFQAAGRRGLVYRFQCAKNAADPPRGSTW